ncbi:Unknown protein [Striga hermonthica]|uniref:F-box protein At3g26010-like beta-propeller domain-containing protein n=1 Tax=Striga hermonthica TaxID=68872 RepID=A0A9N7N7F4_STRHE|nr:Unknown protein [Striga hermonthica]
MSRPFFYSCNQIGHTSKKWHIYPEEPKVKKSNAQAEKPKPSRGKDTSKAPMETNHATTKDMETIAPKKTNHATTKEMEAIAPKETNHTATKEMKTITPKETKARLYLPQFSPNSPSPKSERGFPRQSAAARRDFNLCLPAIHLRKLKFLPVLCHLDHWTYGAPTIRLLDRRHRLHKSSASTLMGEKQILEVHLFSDQVAPLACWVSVRNASLGADFHEHTNHGCTFLSFPPNCPSSKTERAFPRQSAAALHDFNLCSPAIHLRKLKFLRVLCPLDHWTYGAPTIRLLDRRRRLHESSASTLMVKRMKLVDNNSPPRDLKAVCDFLEEANEDILLEIFIRLPNYAVAILFGSFCRRWHSLISHPRFVSCFVSHRQLHRDRYPQPHTVIFCLAEKAGRESPKELEPLCHIFSNESTSLLHGSWLHLDFLPLPEVVIRASCGDLVLVSPVGRQSISDLYICNPITRQYRQVPRCRRRSFKVYGYALILNRDSSNSLDVVLLHLPEIPHYGPPRPTEQKVSVYRSATGQWEVLQFRYPLPSSFATIYSVDPVARDGVVYFVEFERWSSVRRVVCLDVSRGEGSVIRFPRDFWWFPDRGVVAVRQEIGFVAGESGLRLVQVVVLSSNKRVFHIKVWEVVAAEVSEWVLVHDRTYARPKGEGLFVGPYLHPMDGAAVLIVWERGVYQYNLVTTTWEKVGQLRDPLKLKVIEYESYDHRLTSFPILHSDWPTPIPPL